MMAKTLDTPTPPDHLKVVEDPTDRKLMILEALAMAKAEGRSQADVREKYQVTASSVGNLMRSVRAGRLKPVKAVHPALFRMLNLERLAEARKRIRPAHRKKAMAKKAATLKAKAEKKVKTRVKVSTAEKIAYSTPTKERTRRPPARPKVKAQAPITVERHDFITRTLEKIATNHDDFEGVLTRCLTIVDKALT